MENIKIRKRTTQACDQCSKYRRKCNGQSPCLLCMERGRQCSYTKIAKKRGPIVNGGESKKDSGRAIVSPKTPDGYEFSLLNTTIKKEVCKNPVENWSRQDFLTTIVTDSTGYRWSILDMYFTYPYQHLPMFSKVWITQNIQDVPMHVLHVIYMLVLVHAKDRILNGNLIAKPHATYVKDIVNNEIENCDPFLVSTMMNLAMYEFYNQESDQSIFHLAMAVKSAQILGLDRDEDLLWRSTASGRILGNEIGMDKQFLRSLWFLMYQWDHNNILIYKCPMLIDTLIPNHVISSYIPPNIGDPSNIPLNFLTHSQYSLPLHSIGKEIFMVDSNHERMELLYKLDTFHLIMPISYTPQPTIFLGRTVSWINEVYYFSKFCLLVPLYLDGGFIPFDKHYIPNQLNACINSLFASALAFINYSNSTVNSDQTYIFFSTTLFVAALAHCMVGNARREVLEVFAEAIRLSGFTQDLSVMWEAAVDKRKSVKALISLLTF